jgi:membrane-bound lytic murein transglycosylase B
MSLDRTDEIRLNLLRKGFMKKWIGWVTCLTVSSLVGALSLDALAAPAQAIANADVAPAPIAYSDPRREDVKKFISELADEEGFDPKVLTQVFSQAKYKQKIVDAISRPAERTLNWREYQDIFLTERRVREGKKFMAEHEATLARAYSQHGVPPEIVAAIIGVETMYGSITGNYRVIDSLSTLAFDYPPRGKFFRSELKQFFLLAREEGQNPLEPKGSYAGAMGYGQFISSSYRAYAVDFDGDGVRDIWHNPVDAIGSVANYLSRHGWRKGEAVTQKVDVQNPGEPLEDLFNVKLAVSSDVAQLTELGVLLSENLAQTTMVSPMRLLGKNGYEYWLGLQNFYVITRYNHSKLYAMAVFQLSERLKAEG